MNSIKDGHRIEVVTLIETLGKIGNSRVTQSLIERLDENKEVRDAAIQALINIGEPTLTELAQGVENTQLHLSARLACYVAAEKISKSSISSEATQNLINALAGKFDQLYQRKIPKTETYTTIEQDIEVLTWTSDGKTGPEYPVDYEVIEKEVLKERVVEQHSPDIDEINLLLSLIPTSLRKRVLDQCPKEVSSLISQQQRY